MTEAVHSNSINPFSRTVPSESIILPTLDEFCPPGWSGTEWECSECAAGTYTKKANQSSCNPCGYGNFQPEKEATACDKCPSPQTTYGKTSKSASDCEGPALLIKQGTIDVTRTPNFINF